jgi:hypothetical protein
VQTCRGSHTHTWSLIRMTRTTFTSMFRERLSFGKTKSWPAVRRSSGQRSKYSAVSYRGDQSALQSPQDAKVVSSPRVFIDPRTGAINALQSAASHGTGKPSDTNQCHDITVYSALGLAAEPARKWTTAGHQRSGESKAHRCGKRPNYATGTRLIFERWEEGCVHR